MCLTISLILKNRCIKQEGRKDRFTISVYLDITIQPNNILTFFISQDESKIWAKLGQMWSTLCGFADSLFLLINIMISYIVFSCSDLLRLDSLLLAPEKVRLF